MKKNKIVPINEILCAFLSASLQGKSESTFLRSNPRMFIFAKTNVEIQENINISIVENNKENIHLILPYYETLQNNSSSLLEDEELIAFGAGMTDFSAIHSSASIDESVIRKTQNNNLK